MKFHMVIAICLNFKLWIHKKFVSQLQAHENWPYFYVMETEKMAIFQFFLPPGKLIEVNFFLVPTRKFLWHLGTTYKNFIKIWKTFT